MTDVNVFGALRGTVRTFFGASTSLDVQPQMTEGGALIVQQDLPERTLVVQNGRSFGCALPTGSAFTFVAAWPTTLSQLVLYNAESSSGPSYVIDRAWMSAITAGGTGPAALLAQIIPLSATGPVNVAPVDSASVLRWSLSGKTTQSPSARLIISNSTYAIANKWFPIGQGQMGATNPIGSLGLTVEAQLQGRIIIPPGAGLGLAGLCATAGGTVVCGLDWHEAYLNLV